MGLNSPLIRKTYSFNSSKNSSPLFRPPLRPSYTQDDVFTADHGCYDTRPFWYTSSMSSVIYEACEALDGYPQNNDILIPPLGYYFTNDRHGTEYRIWNDMSYQFLHLDTASCRHEMNYIAYACTFNIFSYSGWTRHPSGNFRSTIRISSRVPL